MTLFFSLLPLYIFGNVHCLGMCGPLVMLIGRHPYRYLYFLGRICSFTMACWIAGEMGAVLHQSLKQFYFAEFVSLFFGGLFTLIGLKILLNYPKGLAMPENQFIKKINEVLSSLLLKEQPGSTFLFGFFTVFLPCGQTLIVFSACALLGDPIVGFFNGLAFSILTTPSLVLAMHTLHLFKKFKRYYQTILGLSTVFVGLLSICRGLAEMGLISHLILNPDAASHYHIVLF